MAYSNDNIYWTRVDNAASPTIKVQIGQKFDEFSLPLLQQIVSQFYTNIAVNMPTENVATILSDLGETVGDILEENTVAIRDAYNFLIKRDYKEATKIYKALSMIYKRSNKILYNRGVSLLGEKSIDEALSIAEQLIEIASDKWQYYHLSAGCLIALQRYSEAEKRLLEALHLAPQSTSILNVLGLLLYWQNCNEEALQYFYRIFEGKSETAETCFNTALCLTSLGLYSNALLLYDVCLSLNPNFL